MAAAAADDDEGDDDGDGGDDKGGEATDLLDSGWFVPASRLDDYKEAERVYDRDEDTGLNRLRMHRKGSFI